jgi:hypothetical protein
MKTRIRVNIGPLCGAVLAVLLAALATNVAASPEVIEAECHAQLNMPPGACACIGRTAGDELTADEQAFVVAAITGDETASAELRSRMSLDALTKAAMFMANTPARCAAQR